MNESRSGEKMTRKQAWGASIGLAMLALAMGWRWLWPSLQTIDWSRPTVDPANQQRIEALAAAANETSPDDTAPPPDDAGEPEAAVAEPDVPVEDAPASPLDEAQIIERDRLLAAAATAMEAKHWLLPEDDNALAFYSQVLAIDARNPTARIGRAALLDNLFKEADSALDDSDDTLARDLVDALDLNRITDQRLPKLAQRVQALTGIRSHLQEASRRLAAGHLFEPDGDSALDSYRAALQLDGRNRASLKGLDDLASGILEEGMKAASNVDFARADLMLAEATAIAPANPKLEEVRDKIAELKTERAEHLLSRAELALKARDQASALTLLAEARALGVAEERIAALAAEVSNAATYSSYQPGDRFADPFIDRSGDGPSLIVIPLGQFRMGSLESERDRRANEGPARTVRITAPFALSRTEITVAQFRRFVNARNYVTDAEKGNGSAIYDEKSGRIANRSGVSWKNDYLGGRAKNNDPVIHVSWNDANAYAGWLAQSTGARYRLPSEAGFEYALRAGTDTAFWWGEGNPTDVVANLTGEGDRSRSKRAWSKAFPRYRDGYWGPAPVAQFAANPFALFDMGGNVSEWVEDCWHENFLRAPEDARAWVNRGCKGRTIKGGSWGSSPEDVRSAFRMGVSPDTRSARIGFRVARELSP